jgi:hypothetical protein
VANPTMPTEVVSLFTLDAIRIPSCCQPPMRIDQN